METKKTKKVAIERFRSTWLLMGVVVALAFMFMAFEWSRHDLVVDNSLAIRELGFEEDLLEIPRTYEQPTPPPPPELEVTPEVLNIVDNNANVTETRIASSESRESDAVEVKEIDLTVVEIEPEEERIFEAVEKMPEFPGGQAALLQFLGKNIKYPTIPQEQGIQGRVIIQFVVDKDGGISDPVVVRSVDPHLDKEALRVIRTMPKWSPGMQQMKPVRVKYTVPVTFRLQ